LAEYRTSQVSQYPYHFVAIGDSQDGNKTYTRLLQNIVGHKPDFVVHLGDMVSSGREEQWDRFFEMTEVLQVPFSSGGQP